jgi:hypothetical protein
MIEHNLLTRYPNLKTKLPPGYEPVVEPHANDTVCVPMRLFTRTELQADTESAAAWETNDSIAVDRILMLRHTDLDFWVRELMPRELEIEREDMLIQNMTSPEIIKNVSEFDRQNKGANCRVIKVIDRKGMRFKLSLHLDFVQGQRQATVAMCYGTLTDIVDMSAKMNPGE